MRGYNMIRIHRETRSLFEITTWAEDKGPPLSFWWNCCTSCLWWMKVAMAIGEMHREVTMMDAALEKMKTAYTSFVSRTLLIAFHWLGHECHASFRDVRVLWGQYKNPTLLGTSLSQSLLDSPMTPKKYRHWDQTWAKKPCRLFYRKFRK